MAAAALGCDVRGASPVPVGWGNENWRVETVNDRFIAKFGPPESAPKWAATHIVYEVGRRAGLDVPALVHFDAACTGAGGWTLRIFTWMEGAPAAEVLQRRPDNAPFFADLARFARALHALPTPAFTSRLDGSSPSFARWSDYVEHRLHAVLGRVAATSAFTSSEASSLVDTITGLAQDVDDLAAPSICHRDLHLGNLLATPTGRLAAVLDFDGAEAWDPAADVVKLRWLVFPHHPGSEEAFRDAYGSPPGWPRRVLLAELLELLNTVPNAIATNDPAFEASARARLRQLLP